MPFRDHVWLVTGASSGIGRANAALLDRVLRRRRRSNADADAAKSE